MPDPVPDAVIVDVRMPPTFTDEGIEAAEKLRALWPALPVLALAITIDASHIARLLSPSPRGVGYLVKHRVTGVDALVDALHRLVDGQTVVDLDAFDRRTTGADQDPLTRLSQREGEVLHLMAAGRSNAGIAGALRITVKTVESHVASVFTKLDIPCDPAGNRRVLAVLKYLREA